MRAQLSLELLLYIALAGLSFFFAIGCVGKAYVKLGDGMNSFELSQFVDAMNTAMLDGGALFGKMYLPSGLCNSTTKGNYISTRYGTYYLVYEVSVQQDAFCPDRDYAQLMVSVKEGVAYINRTYS